MAEGDAIAPPPDEGTDAEAAETEAAETEAAPHDAPTITRVQSALNEAGFDLSVDGILGPNTRAALQEFQRRRDLPPNGLATQQTLRALGLAPAP